MDKTPVVSVFDMTDLTLEKVDRLAEERFHAELLRSKEFGEAYKGLSEEGKSLMKYVFIGTVHMLISDIANQRYMFSNPVKKGDLN